MKKNTALGLIALFASAVNAGAPEAVSAPSTPTTYSFVTLEGTYTHSRTDGFHFGFSPLFDVNSSKDRSRWGGRFAFGLARQLCDQFYASGEIGWGYYGRTTYPLKARGLLLDIFDNFQGLDGIHIKTSQNGFDVLAGLIWRLPCFELFFKAGALIQNYHQNLNIEFDSFGFDLVGGLSTKTNRMEALPEIRLGGSYYISDSWAITASWMHAFGTRQKIDFDLDLINPLGDSRVNLRNPTLNILTIGVQLRFC